MCGSSFLGKGVSNLGFDRDVSKIRLDILCQESLFRGNIIYFNFVKKIKMHLNVAHDLEILHNLKIKDHRETNIRYIHMRNREYTY